jgi:hypothetical protein
MLSAPTLAIWLTISSAFEDQLSGQIVGLTSEVQVGA